MRKNLLFFLMAMLMPCLAWADNMAIERTKPDSYASGWGTKRDNRLGVPCEAAGFSSPMSGTENYTISAWINPSGVNDGGVILALSPQVHFNNNGNWVLMSSPSGELSLGGHGGDTDHGAGLPDSLATLTPKSPSPNGTM